MAGALGLTFNGLFSSAAKVVFYRFNQIYRINHLCVKAKIIFRCLSGIRTDPSGVLREPESSVFCSLSLVLGSMKRLD